MANAADLAQGEIPDHTPVIGSDGRNVGTVDGTEGEYIKLMRDEAGQHRWLPRKLVASLEGGLVRLSLPAAQAAEAMVDEAALAQRMALDPDAGAAFGRPDDSGPHGSRAQAHGPKGSPERLKGGQRPAADGGINTHRK
ncbi:DUF2171 domain-containing protein [Belnapia sp. T18]|uniref:DUF2171 domain-containing protein n=1 Tax=Belnapia arida TaxID=2804533 RepID=A0ABS1TYU4_9PROT|nr:DUF2171 domain-containing protein [Belnapia arida]MBL6077415.1 DUF2171 domain-containing protein [Belnapia arida]